MTDSELHTLEDPTESTRLIRVRVEGPAGYRAGAPLPHAIVVHGFKGFMHWGFFPELSRRIAESGVVCVSVNLSGCGVGADLMNFTDEEGFARNTHSREIEDIARVRAWLRVEARPGIDVERAALLGHSRGGGMAIVHASEDGGYRAVATWAAIGTVNRVSEAEKRAWRESGHMFVHNGRTGQDHRLDLDILDDVEANPARLDILAACQRLSAPTLVVHGTEDATVGIAEGERIAGALARPTFAPIEGAGHTFGAVHPFAGTTPHLEAAIEATLGHLGAHA